MKTRSPSNSFPSLVLRSFRSATACHSLGARAHASVLAPVGRVGVCVRGSHTTLSLVYRPDSLAVCSSLKMFSWAIRSFCFFFLLLLLRFPIHSHPSLLSAPHHTLLLFRLIIFPFFFAPRSFVHVSATVSESTHSLPLLRSLDVLLARPLPPYVLATGGQNVHSALGHFANAYIMPRQQLPPPG